MITFLQIAGGLLFLFLGGEILVRGAVALAKNLGLSTFVIGLTVVAYGTSSPELVISTQASLNGYPDIALGNVIGSNISNILCVMGLTAVIYPIAIDKKLSFFDGIFMLGVTILFYLISLTGKVSFVVGSVFIVMLCVYTWLVFKKAKQTDDGLPKEQIREIEEQIKVSLGTPQALLACAAGFGLLLFGSDILIKGAITLATAIGLSQAAIGVTLIAFGSSVPELATSLIAAFHKRSEIVFGNIIGSNLFNILGIIGVSSIVSPMEVNRQFLTFDMPIMFGVTLWLVFLMYKFPTISRPAGGLFVVGYIAYISAQFF